MSHATLVDEDSFADSRGSRERAVRFCYSRSDGAVLQFVIVDIGRDGNEDWAEQEAGELSWYPFTPTADDRRLIDGWIEFGCYPSGWPLLVVPSKRRRP